VKEATVDAKRSTVIFAWLLLLPAILYITVIVAYPLVDTFILSFTDASLKRTTEWVGWANYTKIFNATFAEVILRTFVWTFFSVSFKMIIGIFGACMLNAAVPGRTIFRMLTMPPWIVPMAIGIFMWGWMYNGQFGMISGMLQRFGLVDGPVAFLANGSTAFWATIMTDVWIGVPLVTLYMLAAMQSIPQDLYEAAWTDGAGRFYRFRRITLPLLVPAMITMSMLSLIATFNSFDIIWILTRGGPSGETTTMIIDTYRTAIGSNKYGEGAARAVLICIFLSIFCVCYFRVTSRLSAGDKR
jgi:multiple sugar transport system permease protein